MQWSKITDATDDTNQVDDPNLQQTCVRGQEGAAANATAQQPPSTMEQRVAAKYLHQHVNYRVSHSKLLRLPDLLMQHFPAGQDTCHG